LDIDSPCLYKNLPVYTGGLFTGPLYFMQHLFCYIFIFHHFLDQGLKLQQYTGQT